MPDESIAASDGSEVQQVDLSIPVSVDDIDRITLLFGKIGADSQKQPDASSDEAAEELEERTKDAVDHALDVVLKAGAAEGLDYATGRAVFSTMADLRAYRVYRLVEAGMTLDESERFVAALFKVTPTAARRLVTNALARYQWELDTHVIASVQTRLKGARWVEVGSTWEVVLPPGFVRDRVLELCRSSNKATPSDAKRGAVMQFAHETYTWLCPRVGLEPKPKSAK